VDSARAGKGLELVLKVLNRLIWFSASSQIVRVEIAARLAAVLAAARGRWLALGLKCSKFASKWPVFIDFKPMNTLASSYEIHSKS
jgi:hypothetical protein